MMRRLGHRTRGALVAGLAAVALASAGCGGDGHSPASSSAAPSPAVTAATGSVGVWFADGDGVLRRERREAAATAEPLRAAMDALAAGPSDPTLLPALPTGTRVLDVSSDGAVATVDLSAELETGYPPGGAAAELAVVGPIVRTAAEASGAARVRILVEGRSPAPPGSQFDFSQPFAQGDLPGP